MSMPQGREPASVPGCLRGSPGGSAHLLSRGKVCLFRTIQADVAQLAEQLICNQQVRGSIPLVSSGFICSFQLQFPLRNLLPTTILPVCLFSGIPSNAYPSGLLVSVLRVGVRSKSADIP